MDSDFHAAKLTRAPHAVYFHLLRIG